MQDYIIDHQMDREQFVVTLENEIAVLKYRVIADNVVDFCHTYVPGEARGKGLAEQLVHKGLAWAKAQEYKVTASCWYVEKFLK
jgi:predicted GNAT family acetyltransferase